MNAEQRSTAIETLSELRTAIETSNRDYALTCLSFLDRLLAAPVLADHKLCRCRDLAAAYYLVDPDHLFLPGRTESVVMPRQLAMYLANKLGFKPPVIGRYFNRNDGTVSHAIRTVQNRMDVAPALATAVQQMLTQLEPRSSRGHEAHLEK